MNIHEYQAKKIFEQYGIKIPKGKIVDWNESKKQNKIVFKDRNIVNSQNIIVNSN